MGTREIFKELRIEREQPSEKRTGRKEGKTSWRKLFMAITFLPQCIRVPLRPQHAGVPRTRCGYFQPLFTTRIVRYIVIHCSQKIFSFHVLSSRLIPLYGLHSFRRWGSFGGSLFGSYFVEVGYTVFMPFRFGGAFRRGTDEAL